MRTGNLLFSFIQLLFTLFLFALGIFILMLPKAPNFQHLLTHLFDEKSYILSLIGWGLALVSVFLFVAFYVMHRRYSWTLVMGKNLLTVDEPIVQRHLETYWKQLFPHKEVSSEVVIKRNRMHLFVEFPAISFEEQKPLLEKVEHDIQRILVDSFGYRKEFYLTASFRS